MIRKLILSLVVIAFSLTACAAAGTNQFKRDNLAMIQIYREACRLSAYKCIEQPIVRRTGVADDNSLWGFYTGGNVLWIGNDAKGTRAWLTMFHEAIHYLQTQGKAPVNNSLLACAQEREAMELSNMYVDILGAPVRHKRSVAKWKRIYKC